MVNRFATMLTSALVLAWCQSGLAQDSDAPASAYAGSQQFGGPTSVGGQLKSDHDPNINPYWFGGVPKKTQPYYDYKAEIEDEYGLSFGADYNALYQGATQSLGEDAAAGGVARIYGTWALLDRGSADSGSLTFKLENRHRLGTDIAPQQLASETGYAGLTAITFSDAGMVLTNLYWQQSFRNNRLAFIAGIVDVTDYVAVFGLVNPWTDFINLAFSTDPTIPSPDQGLGAAVRARLGSNYYVQAGLADANGNPGKPFNSFDTFFNEHEYFKHIEIGWYSSWQNRFTDNVHLTAWQADQRKVADIPSGWGAAFSYSRKFKERWMPFLRVGYADGGGAPLERSISAGLGYFRQTRSDVLGIGLNWGRPNSKIYGPGLRDQYTAEAYYLFQFFQHMTIAPNIQLIIDPALNPEEDSLWVLGLRARVSF